MISVIIPVFNEEKTVEKLVKEVLEQKKMFDLEIIAIDDCSSDDSFDILKKIEKQEKNVFIFRNEENRGKGFSLKKGIEEAKGEIIVFQDADTEYSPKEYSKLFEPIINNQADIVYGSRFLNYFGKKNIFYYANQFLTKLSNFSTGLNLTDMETCFKVFRADILKKLNLKENRFGIEPEITALISKEIKKSKLNFIEVSISYNPRNYDEGKKIGIKDGLRAVFVILTS